MPKSAVMLRVTIHVATHGEADSVMAAVRDLDDVDVLDIDVEVDEDAYTPLNFNED